MCEDNVVVCDGGDGALGHPIEYIRLDTVSDKPQSCPYCGLRYQLAPKKNRYGHVMNLH
jgi:NADH dehydrogenase (ubiquinone) Fe-S protein 6